MDAIRRTSWPDSAMPPGGTKSSIGWLQWRIPRRDVGILPLVLICPFMYYPKVLEGDTQPWLLLAAILALFTFRTDRFIEKRDWPLALLSLLCVAVYAARADLGYGFVRAAYTYVAFLAFWVVCQRDGSDYMRIAVKATVLIWFVVGVYQYVLVKLGFDIGMGRYVPGRSGVPSLTAEASFYGSLSLLQLMYLITEKHAKNGIYIACATISIVLSGSVLAMLLLVFPLWKLPLRIRVVSALLLSALVVGDFYLSDAGVVARVTSIAAGGVDLTSDTIDASLNLRAGNIYFTLVQNLIPSLLLQGRINFMSQYNDFASQTGALMQVESDAILPAIGEMIYGSGLVAVVLLIVFLKRSLAHCHSRRTKIGRLLFILACMLNPITLSNIFLISYTQTED